MARRYRTYGVMAQVSTDKKNLWWDHARKEYNPRGFGVMAGIRAGWHYAPIGQLWRPEFWMLKKGDKEYNGWEGKYWFVARFPIIFPYISVALGRFGLYLGVKPFHICRPRYYKWLPEWEEYTQEDEVLTLTASIRRTRW